MQAKIMAHTLVPKNPTNLHAGKEEIKTEWTKGSLSWLIVLHQNLPV